MSIMTDEFKVRVTTALVQSNEVYKGEFKTVAELDKISAYEGDYADVYETNTRWVFINGAWSNSEQTIPINPTLATKQDIDTLSERVPAGGKKGQNLTKKSDNNYDIYWADPDDINSIEHITLNGEDVPVEDKTANIKVDAKTIGFESTNVAYTDKVNTFTERQKFNIPSTNPDDTWYHGYIDASAVNVSKTEYDGGIETGRTNNHEAILTSESLKLKRQINTQNGSTQYLIQLDLDGIKKAEYVNHVLANYRYLFPKTYPNQNVTLATIEDLNAQLDTKLDKAGGTISGSLIIAENLTVQGKTTSVDTQNLKVADKLIEVGKGNTAPLTSPAGLITPKYDGTNNGGIVYDHTGTAYVGDITLDSNGNVDVNNSDLQPIATRNATITNGNLVKWDSENLKLVDAGKNVENLVDKLAASLRNQAYVRNANGEDTGLAYTYTDEGNSLAVRNASGQLQVSDPSQDKDAANKSYADNLNARYVSTSILGG